MSSSSSSSSSNGEQHQQPIPVLVPAEVQHAISFIQAAYDPSAPIDLPPCNRRCSRCSAPFCCAPFSAQGRKCAVFFGAHTAHAKIARGAASAGTVSAAALVNCGVRACEEVIPLPQPKIRLAACRPTYRPGASRLYHPDGSRIAGHTTFVRANAPVPLIAEPAPGLEGDGCGGREAQIAQVFCILAETLALDSAFGDVAMRRGRGATPTHSPGVLIKKRSRLQCLDAGEGNDVYMMEVGAPRISNRRACGGGRGACASSRRLDLDLRPCASSGDNRAVDGTLFSLSTARDDAADGCSVPDACVRRVEPCTGNFIRADYSFHLESRALNGLLSTEHGRFTSSRGFDSPETYPYSDFPSPRIYFTRPISALFRMPSYALRVHSCEEVVWSRRKAPNLYVVVYQDGRAVHRTNAVKRNRTPEWDDICNLSSDSTITLRLWHDCLLRCRDICLGAVDTEISALLNPASSDTEYIRLPLTSEDRGSGKHTGTVLVCLVHDGAAASMAIEQSKQNIGQLAHVSALMEAAGMVDSSQPAVKTFEAGLGIIITKLDRIIQIGNEVAKIHPYANMAWKVLTSVYQAVKAEQEKQEKLRKLVDNMVSVYSFTEETDVLPQKIKSLEDKVLAIVKQTVECAVFIQEYSGHGFTARVMKNTWDNADKTIDELSETLLKLKDSLEGSLTVHVVFLSAQVLQKVDRLGVSYFLFDMFSVKQIR
ncbi:hypothetical protein DFH06DRAFT_1330263 [Mycena polygramma]|nr:hypothetical protein DFH06DRAFT_1330263 [Mycena polygramma]